MQILNSRFQIRVRTHFEILDFSILIWREHFLRLALCAIVGFLPLIPLNLLITNMLIAETNQPNEFFSVYYFSFWLHLLEIPWATAWITLYLGEVTFANQISIRKMIQSYFQALPKLFVHQFIFRGFCCLCCVLWVYPIIMMKFLNEIILLEREPWKRLHKRSTLIHRHYFGHTLEHTVVDTFLFIILFTAFFLMTQFVKALLFPDGNDLGNQIYLLSLEGPAELIQQLLGTWEQELRFWIVMSFFAVSRYLTYLDLRIRREGWDVEIKMRLQGSKIRQQFAQMN